jgi:hypothetical protein
MSDTLLHKTNTGISSEFFVAAELARRGYNVTLTLGNTKAIDLLVEKEGKLIPLQVKGIQRRASICWNISLAKIEGHSLFYILVNLNADTLEAPEYFVLTETEVKAHFKATNSGRDYLDYNLAKKLGMQDQWQKLGQPIMLEAPVPDEFQMK